jgi:hypothetical protein
MTVSGAKDLLLLGVVGIGLYYVYKAVSGATNLASGAVNAATCAISSGIASCIVNWTTCSAIQLSGNAVFPNGAQVAINSLPVGSDSQGGVYVQYSGGVYQLSPSNSCGNYNATQIS